MKVREAVGREAQEIDMKQPCSLKDLLGPISRMNENLEAAIVTLPFSNALGKKKAAPVEGMPGDTRVMER